MQLLFIADPLSSFNIAKDSSFAMMREAAGRGHALWACEIGDVHWRLGQPVQARMHRLTLLQVEHKDAAAYAGACAWYRIEETRVRPLAELDAVLMRKDPPVESEFIYTTHLLSQAEREGARVFNRPQALRDISEKLALMEFAPLLGAHMAPTLVTRDPLAMRAFHAEHRDIILKPLDGMGGMGIFRVKPDGLNLGSIIESLGHNGTRTLMLQAFLPDIALGDKRILLIQGQPLPYALARIPQGGEVRGNLAAGGKGVAQALSATDLKIAQLLGPTLAQRGLLLVGLDVIGSCLTEINVTSPTCFQEITAQTSLNVAATFMDALQALIASSRPRLNALH